MNVSPNGLRETCSLAVEDWDVNLRLLATLSSNLRRSQSTLEDNDTNIQKETEMSNPCSNSTSKFLFAVFFSIFICNKVSLNNTSRKNWASGLKPRITIKSWHCGNFNLWLPQLFTLVIYLVNFSCWYMKIVKGSFIRDNVFALSLSPQFPKSMTYSFIYSALVYWVSTIPGTEDKTVEKGSPVLMELTF